MFVRASHAQDTRPGQEGFLPVVRISGDFKPGEHKVGDSVRLLDKAVRDVVEAAPDDLINGGRIHVVVPESVLARPELVAKIREESEGLVGPQRLGAGANGGADVRGFVYDRKQDELASNPRVSSRAYGATKLPIPGN